MFFRNIDDYGSQQGLGRAPVDLAGVEASKWLPNKGALSATSRPKQRSGSHE